MFISKQNIKFTSLEIFILIIFIPFCNSEDNKKEDYLIIELAHKQGYDLTNPTDPFFINICRTFTSENKKDVSLEYRRKYYYYPVNNKQTPTDNNIFKPPIKNAYYKCISDDKSIPSPLKNFSLLILIPIVIAQILITLLFIINNYLTQLSNSPLEKITLIENKLLGKKIEPPDVGSNSSYVRFNREALDDEKNEKNNNNNIDNKISNNNEISNNNADLEKNKVKLQQQIDNTGQNTFPTFDLPVNLSADTNEKSNKKFLNKEVYSFEGKVTPGFIVKKDSSSEKNIPKVNFELNDTNKKMNVTQFIYHKMNINPFKQFTYSSGKIQEFAFVNEEYFYFSYENAIEKDDRNIITIYKDLLEQCQIVFKFISILNVYEDKKVSVVYYCLKVNLHFLLHTLLFKDSFIDKIYDGTMTILDNLYRCLLSTIIVSILGTFLYTFTNAKKSLINIRHKICSLNTKDAKLISDILTVMSKIAENVIFFKIAILFFTCLIVFLASFILYFFFCSTYPNTQHLILECVLINIAISQVSPFLFCWIPAYLRYIAIKSKNKKLFKINKLIERFFIP